ncbi:splicing factor 3a, subunit 1 [Boothiomyces macroporosus]|uniref:Splicing factor 3a, subunit 1 n=1 Tax=Boothiomyces macroporosus TaxID=261099 RepID=A0AAD5UID6_9FUNG|nr:splicing factor 3a, subunit 1 [Boothiomyces macroporosus]
MDFLDEEPDNIIYPPPDIKRNSMVTVVICDKTAVHVAKNGPGFEDKLREKETHNQKFCFLFPNDPYFAYYQWKVKKAKEEMGKFILNSEAEKPQKQEKKEEKVVEQTPVHQDIPVMTNIPLPPPQYEFLVEIPSITKQDMDILKLTAQYVARNGASFMTDLGQREQKNFQFDFLRPSHSLYPYFTRLVDQYSRVLIPPPHIFPLLELNSSNRQQIIDRIMKRVEFEAYKYQEKARKQHEAEEEKSNNKLNVVAFATIDWHDFVVVETIEFLEADERAVLPPPMSVEELESMTLEQRKSLLKFEAPRVENTAEPDDMEMDEDVDMEEDEEPSQPTVSAPERTTYVPKVGRHAAAQEAYQICPRCKQNVKVTDMAEHVRLELLDPKWKDEKAAFDEKTRDSGNIVSGDIVAQNLKNMASMRTDIFGGSAGEIDVGQKVAFEKEKGKEAAKAKVIWDGRQGSVAAATAKAQMLSGETKKPPPPPMAGPIIPPPIKGVPFPPVFPPVFPPPPFGMPVPGMPYPYGQPAPPPPKKQKLDPAAKDVPVDLVVNLPNGNTINFKQLKPDTIISQLKKNLVKDSGIAAGKQKLVSSQGFALKNSETLFESGISTGEVLTLSRK